MPHSGASACSIPAATPSTTAALRNYTWSKVIDTLPDQTSVVPGNANTKHRWVLSGVWDFDYAKNLLAARFTF